MDISLHPGCVSRRPVVPQQATRPLQPQNRARLLLGPVVTSPSLTQSHVQRYELGTRTNTLVMDTWILGLWGSGGASDLRGQSRYVSSSYCHFRVVHSSILLARMACFSFLAHPANPTYRIHLTLQLWLACKDSNCSSNPRHPHLSVRPLPA